LRLTPSQAIEAFGPHGHVAGLYVMVEPQRPGGSLWAMARAESGGKVPSSTVRPSSSEGTGRRALVIQDCLARGAAEWDAANRRAAKGVVERTEVSGSRVVMHCLTGTGRARFGPSARQTGAQALESLLEEDETGNRNQGDPVLDLEPRLRLRWRGLAGAGMGLAHGMARAPNLLWTDYPEVRSLAGVEGLLVGGEREVVVETVVPALTRLMVGIDDTDTPEKGATWALGFELGRHLEESLNQVKVLEHRLVQLWPGVAEKTTNCVALGLSIASPPGLVKEIREGVLDFVAEKAHSPEAAVALHEGIQVPPSVVEYCLAARRERIALEQTKAAARHAKVVLEPVVGQRGLIGALAAIGGLDMGPEVASVA